jgi:hypothetical protein
MKTKITALALCLVVVIIATTGCGPQHQPTRMSKNDSLKATKYRADSLYVVDSIAHHDTTEEKCFNQITQKIGLLPGSWHDTIHTYWLTEDEGQPSKEYKGKLQYQISSTKDFEFKISLYESDKNNFRNSIVYRRKGRAHDGKTQKEKDDIQKQYGWNSFNEEKRVRMFNTWPLPE